MPIKVADMLAALETPGYIVRQTLTQPKYINRAKKAIKKAFTYQLENRCFSLVELVSTCPTNWGMTPMESLEFIKERMIPYYPLGDYRVAEGVKGLK